MAEETSVLFVGCGNMGAALAAGYAAAHPAVEVLSLDRDPQRARALLPAGSRVTVHGELAALAGRRPDVVVLALKPQALGAGLAELQPLCADALVVSIAAGVPLARLVALLGGPSRVVRAMLNLPAVVGAAMTTLYAADLAAADRDRADRLFAAVGDVAWLADESAIDLATAVAGSGPAYFFAFVEQLAAAGIAAGLEAELAGRLARQTAIGAAALLAADPRPAGALKIAVCSPGGTTEAGLATIETASGLAPLLAAGVAAACRRAGELAEA